MKGILGPFIFFLINAFTYGHNTVPILTNQVGVYQIPGYPQYQIPTDTPGYPQYQIPGYIYQIPGYPQYEIPVYPVYYPNYWLCRHQKTGSANYSVSCQLTANSQYELYEYYVREDILIENKQGQKQSHVINQLSNQPNEWKCQDPKTWNTLTINGNELATKINQDGKQKP